jgi:hypothetical protein
MTRDVPDLAAQPTPPASSIRWFLWWHFAMEDRLPIPKSLLHISIPNNEEESG